MADTPQPAIALSAVGKVFRGGVAALGPINLAIAAGEFVALLGPSGCGKSTALRLIAGLETPSAGRVTIDTGGKRRPFGVVFQEPTLMPWADVRANVALPLRLAGMPASAAGLRVANALARVGLSDFAAALPRELSGGMRMRASLARALVTEPALLLMDEPFAALDEITRYRLNDDLLAVWRALGITVVFVTHSVSEAVYLAQRVVVLTPRPGRVAADIAVDAPILRGAEFRGSPHYAEQCRVVAAALAAAMGEAA